MKNARIAVNIVTQTEKAVRVTSDVYRSNDMANASAWLPKSQITVSELNDPDNTYTHVIDLPMWLFKKVEKETNADWHNINR